MNSWDDYMDALSALPLWAQYAAQQRLRDLIATETQLRTYGTAYPHVEPLP